MHSRKQLTDQNNAPRTPIMPHKKQSADQPSSMCLYRPWPVALDDVQMLLSSATETLLVPQNNSCMFAVIQDRALLRTLSDESRICANREIRNHLPHMHTQKHFDIFYNAGTLIVLYGESIDNFIMPDCWLIAENIMLQACRMGLGTCLAGLATAVLNTPDWKSRLGIPHTARAIAPIVVGTLETGMTKPAAQSSS